MCVCVCASVCVHVCACVHVCVRVQKYLLYALSIQSDWGGWGGADLPR